MKWCTNKLQGVQTIETMVVGGNMMLVSMWAETWAFQTFMKSSTLVLCLRFWWSLLRGFAGICVLWVFSRSFTLEVMHWTLIVGPRESV